MSLFSSIAQLCPTLRPYGLEHPRHSCSLPTPRACSNSCPSRWWCHPTISSSVFLCPPLLLPPSIFPSIGSFSVTQFFTSGGQSIEVSASASILSMNIQDWFPLWLIGWISVQSKWLSRVFSNTTVQKHQFFGFLYGPTLTSIYDYWKNCSFD